jgi:glycosyltransferase involved in cell wall biosynthesis
LEEGGFKKIKLRWAVFNRLGTLGRLLFANKICSYFGQGRFIVIAQGSSLSLQKERILMVIGQYYPIVGGAEKQCQEQAEELVRRGYKVTVATGRWSNRVKRRERLKGVNVLRIDNFKSLFGIKKGSNISFCFNLFIFLCFSLKKFDIIHIHQALRPAVFCVLANMFYKKPSIVKLSSTGSGNDFKIIKYGKENSVDKVFRLHKLLKKITKVIALNSQIYKELIDEGFSPQKILSIPNGVKIESISCKNYYNTNNIFRIVSIGRLISDKGFDILLDAVSDIRNVHLDIFGKIKDEKIWLKKLKSKKLQDIVTLKGLYRGLSNILPAYDLFILPSLREGMSNSLLEAMSCGLPCIVSDAVGNLEVICSRGSVKYIPQGSYLLEERGILVNQSDIKGLQRSIEFLRHDQNAREKIGIKGRERVERVFAISRVMDRYCALYDSLLSSDRNDYEGFTDY